MRIYRFLFVVLIVFIAGCNADLDKIIVETYADGTPKVVRFYKGEGVDKALVKEEFFYPDGQIRMEGEYKNGMKNGRWISYYNNGNRWSEGYYKKNINEGKTITWHENGQKYYQGYYKNGERKGKWKFWDENGKLIKEIDYGKIDE